MSTAVIYAGQARSFDRCWKNQYWTVLRHLPDPHFFVSVADDVDAPKMSLLGARFPAAKIFTEHVDQPEPPAHPAWTKPGLLDHGPYGASASPAAIWKQLWALNRAWEYYKSVAPHDVTFDAVLRIRPDLHFHWFTWEEPFPKMCLSPWWSRWGGICDRLAILGPEAAEVYFTCFRHLDEMLKDGAPLHPESLMRENLHRRGVASIPELSAWFLTVRKDGSAIPPDPTPQDYVEYIRA